MISISSPVIDSLRAGFDEARGLWRLDRPGHTRPVARLAAVHSGVLTAQRLMRAAQLGTLDALPVARCLEALRGLQCTDGSHLHGCFRWYAEESAPVDTNAAFFTGLNLILLEGSHGESLAAGDRATLRAMLADLFVWFECECATELVYYPNKFLGDVVCAWLLHEQLGLSDKTEMLTGVLDRAADYWLERHWGWGEHLSDVYTAVMLNELSALLLFARGMPAGLEEKYRRMFAELTDIEDAFGGGLRVPTIRTYAFGGRPAIKPFRDMIGSWAERPELVENQGAVEHFNFGHVFHERGWPELAGPARPVRERIEIECFGGAKARAWVTADARLGTLSRWPIMAGTDHPTWGLSWQTMPVAFAAGADGWGFLRWRTNEGGTERFHPARNKRAAYLNNALTDVVAPPITGRTDALQEAGDACVLRRMPAVSWAWETLSDQLVLTGTAFTVEAEEAGEFVSRILLRVGAVPVTVVYFSLGSGVCPRLRREDGETIWEAVWPAEALKGREGVAGLWMIAWGRDVQCPPLPVRPEASHRGPRTRPGADEVWEAAWPRADGSVGVTVDPSAEAEPLALV